jgi:hypothetical protein
MDLIRTDVLCDATGFTLDNFGLTDRIEKSGLTVVDMTHHGHDRRSCDETILVVDIDLVFQIDIETLQDLTILILRTDDLELVPDLATEDLECVLVDGLCGSDHLTELEERCNQLAWL